MMEISHTLVIKHIKCNNNYIHNNFISLCPSHYKYAPKEGSFDPCFERLRLKTKCYNFSTAYIITII